MSCSVYILYSRTVDRYYIGVSQDVQRRVHQHNAGYAPATKGRGPWRLCRTEVYPTRAAARRREAFLKRQKSRRYLEQLLAQL